MQDLEKTLFAASDKMRGSVAVAEYQHICLGLIFLMYISHAFEKRHQVLMADPYADAEDKDEYKSENIFWVPQAARWSYICENARSPIIGKLVDEAMSLIEAENDKALKGALPRVFSNSSLPKDLIGSLIDLFANKIRLDEAAADFDLMGRVYEYFLGSFASGQGKAGGEFYTPSSMVQTLVEMIEPIDGDAYDPCCGSGGMYVQSGKFVDAHQGKKENLRIYGQEREVTTWRLARMNMAIRGIEAKLHWNNEGTLLSDGFQGKEFDYILANPPFNLSDWKGATDIDKDIRWQFGVPPAGNANFAWLQHIVHHLAPKGFGGVILSNGSLSSETSGEGDIRRSMVEGRRGLGMGNALPDIPGGVVDCIVSLPGQMFFGTQIPACLWILSKDRSNGTSMDGKLRDRRNEILFIDARNLGKMISRTQKGFLAIEIDRIASTYHRWRSSEESQRQNGWTPYQDEPGFCRSASIKVVADSNYVLNPSRYVGSNTATVSEKDFVTEFNNHKGKLRQSFILNTKRTEVLKQVLGFGE